MTPEEKSAWDELLNKGVRILSSDFVETLVSALEPRGINPDAARLFIGCVAEECFDYWLGNKDAVNETATPEEQSRLSELEKNLKGLKSERRLLHMLYLYEETDSDPLDHIDSIVDALEKLKESYPRAKRRGRPRTRDNRLSLVRRACMDWQRITGQAATSQPALNPGFHEVFLAVWGATTTEELTSDALTNDIKAALNTL